MLSDWPCCTWRFFMIWFHKIYKFIFQKQPSCPRNICTEHWRKLPNLTPFLEFFFHLKNNDSVEHMQKVFLNEPFIYLQGEMKSSHCICSIWLFWIFILSLVPPFNFLKWNRYFSACKRKFAQFFKSF